MLFSRDPVKEHRQQSVLWRLCRTR